VPTRVEALRVQHETVRSKLSELMAKRRTLDALLEGVQKSEENMQQTLSQIEQDKNGDTLQERMRKLTDFTRSIVLRCEEVEQCMESLTQHKNNLDTLATRLAPLEDQETGVQSILTKVKSTGNLLTAKIASLEDNEEMSLVSQVKQLTESKNLLEQRVSVLVEEFAKLDSVHGEISTLYSRLNQAQRRTRELDSSLRIAS